MACRNRSALVSVSAVVSGVACSARTTLRVDSPFSLSASVSADTCQPLRHRAWSPLSCSFTSNRMRGLPARSYHPLSSSSVGVDTTRPGRAASAVEIPVGWGLPPT